ncbi:MAG: heme biosynthesis HemY N-terminal domain-containing protein [Pseudomonadota bacterium]
MIWSLLKVGIFLCLAAAITWGAGQIMEDPGEVLIAFGGQEVRLQPLDFIVALAALLLAFWLLLKLAGLIVATIRFFAGGDSAVGRWWTRGHERRGFDSLRDALIAISAGEGKTALRYAEKAERNLDRPALTSMVMAQAADLAGNPARAEAQYRQLLEDDKTRFVGVLGLMKQRLGEGKTDVALKLAEKAFALKPAHEGVMETLFSLQTGAGDWSGARETLKAQVKARILPRDIGARRDAVLALAIARAAEADGQVAAAQAAAAEAISLSPGLVPAAVTAARLKAASGDRKSAERILRRAWEASPHPELAEGFAALVPDEDPEARRKRFQVLLGVHVEHPQTKMLATELALSAEDFPGARRALGDLAESRPTARVLALAAAIERGEGAPDHVVRGFLARALSAPRGEQWICSVCNHVHAEWVPICENCGAFDTLTWQQAAQPEAPQIGDDAALPVIIGAQDPGAPDAPAGPDAAPRVAPNGSDDPHGPDTTATAASPQTETTAAVDLGKTKQPEPDRAA